MKVEVKEDTPTQEVVRKANTTAVIKDSLGRRLTVKKPSVIQQFHLVEALGPELSKNNTYLNMVMPVFWVQDIEGEALYAPATKLEIDAAIIRLGDEGFEAVTDYILKQPGETVTVEALKNASGTPESAKP